MTCLFIGNLIKATTYQKLYDVFSKFGKCHLELKGPYAFVEYENKDDASKALKELNKTNLKGANGQARARIEFSYKRKINDKLEYNEIKEKESNGEPYDEFQEYMQKELEEKDESNIHYASMKEKNSEVGFKKNRADSLTNSIDTDTRINKSICFICKLPGHFAKDCILTKETCYECGEKGHLAKECKNGVREAKTLTENRARAILSQQNTYKFISSMGKIRNIINYLENTNTNPNNQNM